MAAAFGTPVLLLNYAASHHRQRDDSPELLFSQQVKETDWLRETPMWDPKSGDGAPAPAGVNKAQAL